MASMQIRELDPERDAEDVVELQQTVSRFELGTVEGWRHRVASMPEEARLLYLVAAENGRVVGDGQGSLDVFGGGRSAYLTIRVLPEHRRRGIGSALYEAVRAHVDSLGSVDVLTLFDENDAGVAFARAHAFAEARAEVWSVLDPRVVSEEPDSSVELVPAGELDPRELHRVDEEATRDMPSHDQVQEIRYEDWLNFVWRHPFFTRDGSVGALVDGELAAVSFLLADPSRGRAVNMFTGTTAPFRGRGLALAAKLASTRWAAAHGITQIATTNDETNAPMLAVNRRLGYRPSHRRVEYLSTR